MEDWRFENIPVPGDGSCFFTSISVAMNDSMDKWLRIPQLRSVMEHHWERYSLLKLENTDRITQKFVRYMSASAMDKISLEMHNEEASTMNEKIFETPEDLARHVLRSNCWADQAMIRSFMQSTLYMISVVLFDRRTRKPIYAPKEWTYKKMLYICIRLEGNHYTPLRLIFANRPLDMCVGRKEIRMLMSVLSSEHDYEKMY